MQERQLPRDLLPAEFRMCQLTPANMFGVGFHFRQQFHHIGNRAISHILSTSTWKPSMLIIGEVPQSPRFAAGLSAAISRILPLQHPLLQPAQVAGNGESFLARWQNP